MAKVTSPLFSFGATGALGKSIVYGSWKGISYARRYAVPSNPKTAAQVAHRTLFSNAVTEWQGLDAAVKTQWNEAASGYPLTGFNLYVKSYIETDGTPVLPT